MTHVVRFNFFHRPLFLCLYGAIITTRKQLYWSGNASENRLIQPKLLFATPELSKRKSSNPIFYRQDKTLKPLMRSALPAAVIRRGELQQPRAFLLL